MFEGIRLRMRIKHLVYCLSWAATLFIGTLAKIERPVKRITLDVDQHIPEPDPPMVQERYVSVVLSGDNRTFPGILAAMKSTIINAAQPDTLRFYLLCSTGEAETLRKLIHCMLTRHTHPRSTSILYGMISYYQVIEFDMKDYWPNWKVSYREPRYKTDRSAPNNFARLFLHEILSRNVEPDYIPRKIIYLDTDTIVRGDIGELFTSALVNTSAPVAIPIRPLTLGEYSVDFTHPKLREWNEKFRGTSKEISRNFIAYNNGVYVQDLKRWEEQDITPEILYWIEVNREQQLYPLACNPPFLLGLRGRIESLPAEWNYKGLGDYVDLPADEMERAKILHWSGQHKPWCEDTYKRRIWAHFHSPICFNDKRTWLFDEHVGAITP